MATFFTQAEKKIDLFLSLVSFQDAEHFFLLNHVLNSKDDTLCVVGQRVRSTGQITLMQKVKSYEILPSKMQKCSYMEAQKHADRESCRSIRQSLCFRAETLTLTVRGGTAIEM